MEQDKKRSSAYFIIFAISIFLNGYCCFLWSTYPYAVIRYLSLALSGIGPFLLAFPASETNKKGLRIKQDYLFVVSLSILLLLYICLAGSQFKSAPTLGEIVLIFTILFLIMLNVSDRETILDNTIKTFAIIIFPSLVYFLLYSIGITLPHSTLLSAHPGKALLGSYYMHFPFGLINIDPYSPPRWCGIFDEPGFVGTVAVLLFAAGYNKVNKKWAALLLFEAIMTLSLGAYTLLVIFVVVYTIKKGLIKFAFVLLALYIGLMFFIDKKTNNESITALQDRFDVTSTFMLKDNRSTKSFDDAFESFFDKGGYPLWFGNGKYAYSDDVDMAGSFSYKCLVYDFGIVGFCLYIGFFIVCAIRVGKLKDNLPFFIVFLTSIYQRPYVFSILFTTIFILGISTGHPQVKKEQPLELS